MADEQGLRVLAAEAQMLNLRHALLHQAPPFLPGAACALGRLGPGDPRLLRLVRLRLGLAAAARLLRHVHLGPRFLLTEMLQIFLQCFGALNGRH